jgi:hypothetical protein
VTSSPKAEYERRKLERKKAQVGWRDVLRSTPGRVLSFVAGISLLWTFGDRALEAYLNTSPEIHMVGQDASPFMLPFSLKNRSSIFDMRDVEFLCATKHTQVGNLVIQGFSFKEARPNTTVHANKIAAFRCPITNAKTNIQSTVYPVVRYHTLWFPREHSDVNFTWFEDATPPRWVEGYPP